MNKLLLSLPLSLFLLTSVSPVYAHPWQYHVGRSARAHEGEVGNGQASKLRSEEIEAKVTEFRAAQEARRLETLQQLCTKMIDHRLAELNRLKTRVDGSDLTTEQKTEITAEIDAKIAELDTKKDDCASTDLDDLKVLVRDLQKRLSNADRLESRCLRRRSRTRLALKSTMGH